LDKYEIKILSFWNYLDERSKYCYCYELLIVFICYIYTGGNMEYLKNNLDYWSQGYHAPNVDHMVFRLLGKILRPEFGLPKQNELHLDFGCGQGAAVNYFYMNGFNSHGVDISSKDLSIAKNRYPHIANRFHHVDPSPLKFNFPTSASFDLVTAFQSLYYFSKEDFEKMIQRIYASMKSGGLFFATMMGVQSEEFYNNSQATDDPWLRVVNFKNSRINISEYYMFFVNDENDIKDRFSLFKPLHVGYYSAKFRSDEGDGLHYTFLGIKE
jgi:cyclopropane fatty-acyl-phospholipid synthase-like methyltransferase